MYSLGDLLEADARVHRGDLLAVDDLGLLEPLVTVGGSDGVAFGLRVAELGERFEVLVETGFGLIRWWIYGRGRRHGGHGPRGILCGHR